MPITTGFNHVATITADMDRLIAFYVDAFDAKITFEMAAREDHPRMTILDLGGGAALNVFEAPGDAEKAENTAWNRRRPGGRGPIDHYGLAVDSLATLEATRDRLRELGADTGEIQRLGSEWSLFFRDSDGMELEVCCPADA
ncbi:Glyoxalase/bleomycin resistance protein/dioxygenase [Frankia sp. AiPs1]|uniref:VOC family protein n=1 Tax=Frankia sp. AiPa1 TaxID=573492 RepID=UPI002551E996|nr:VOC family protein [Frankia sp. AiPa1]MCL9761662.1 VOC family protein [Frankia sp. AiPa1]